MSPTAAPPTCCAAQAGVAAVTCMKPSQAACVSATAAPEAHPKTAVARKAARKELSIDIIVQVPPDVRLLAPLTQLDACVCDRRHTTRMRQQRTVAAASLHGRTDRTGGRR